jgi:hypothetical protein
MHDSNQSPLASSFVALYAAPHGKPRLPEAELRARYELCEDLACQLVDQAQTLHHTGLDEESVLAAIHAGLAQAQSGLNGQEARWVTLRLAELLAWRSPQLAPPA